MRKEQKTGIIISFFLHFLIIFIIFVLSPYTKRDIEGSIKIIAIENLPEQQKQESQDVKISGLNHNNHENQINHISENLQENNAPKQVLTEQNKTKEQPPNAIKPKAPAKKTVQKSPEKPLSVIEKAEPEKIIDVTDAENKILDNENTVIASNKIILSEKQADSDISQDNEINQGNNVSENIKIASLNSGKPVETEFGRSDAPGFLNKIEPKYPMLARRLGKEGVVKLKLFIDEKGNLTDVRIVDDPGSGLTEAAIEAVKKSTYIPATKNSVKVNSVAVLNINFRLNVN